MKNDYTITDRGDALEVRITGKAYRNIVRIADALNKASLRMEDLANTDNTPTSVFRGFILDGIRTDNAEDANEQARQVADGMDVPEDYIAVVEEELDKAGFE